mgnify:CR=1 FL=1
MLTYVFLTRCLWLFHSQDSLLKFGGMLASGIPDKYALTDATELAKIKRC